MGQDNYGYAVAIGHNRSRIGIRQLLNKLHATEIGRLPEMSSIFTNYSGMSHASFADTVRSWDEQDKVANQR